MAAAPSTPPPRSEVVAAARGRHAAFRLPAMVVGALLGTGCVSTAVLLHESSIATAHDAAGPDPKTSVLRGFAAHQRSQVVMPRPPQAFGQHRLQPHCSQPQPLWPLAPPQQPQAFELDLQPHVLLPQPLARHFAAGVSVLGLPYCVLVYKLRPRLPRQQPRANANWTPTCSEMNGILVHSSVCVMPAPISEPQWGLVLPQQV